MVITSYIPIREYFTCCLLGTLVFLKYILFFLVMLTKAVYPTNFAHWFWTNFCRDFRRSTDAHGGGRWWMVSRPIKEFAVSGDALPGAMLLRLASVDLGGRGWSLRGGPKPRPNMAHYPGRSILLEDLGR